MTLLVPDAGQLSQVMAQSTGPAFILGAVAGFTSILLGRMTTVLVPHTQPERNRRRRYRSGSPQV